ncbi:MAG: hypothetical protein V2B19_19100 [Pseudomonadota bacterium]
MQLHAINDNHQGQYRHRYVIFFMLLFFLSACSNGSGSSSVSSSKTGAIAFRIELQDSASKNRVIASAQTYKAESLNCESTGITSVEAQVYDEYATLLATGGPWACNLHSGKMEGIAAGPERHVVIIGWKGEHLVFRGESVPITVIENATADIGTVTIAPFAPDMLSPADNVSFTATAFKQGEVTFVFGPVPGASSYRFEVATDSGFTSPVIDETVEIAAYTPSVLLYNGTYYWKVRAVDSYGNTGYGPQSPWRFVITSSSSSVTLSANPSELPVGGTSTLKAVVRDANGNNVPDGTIVTFSATGGVLSENSAVTADGIATVQVTTSELFDSVTITATVGDVSNSTIVTYAEITKGRIAFTLAALNCESTGITAVEAQVYDENNTLLANGGPWACGVDSGTIEDVTTGDNRKVVILCRKGEDVAFRGESVPMPVTLDTTTNYGTVALSPFAPDILSPADNTSFTATAFEQGAASFEFSPVSGASSYCFEVASNSDFSSLVIDESVDATTYRPAVLLFNGTYYWKVRAVDPYGNTGPWPDTPRRFLIISPFSVALSANPSELPAGETSILTAVVKDATGANVADGTTVTFSATAGALSASSAVTTAGIASVEFTRSGPADFATITATAREVSSSTTVTFAGVATGHITYDYNGKVYRIKAREGATPENVSLALDGLSPLPPDGKDRRLNISPDGSWLVLETQRFDEGCADWACLAIVAADLSSGDAVRSSSGVIHVEGSPAIASGGNLIVYPNQGGTHAIDLWAVSRGSIGGDWSLPVELTRASPYEINSLPAISNDGRTIVFSSTDASYSGNTSICEVGVDGSGFRVVVTPADSPGNLPDTGDLGFPDYAPGGSIVFQGDWDGTEIWRLPVEATSSVRVSDAFNNDNCPCVLPDGGIASLWLDRPGGSGYYELKVMNADGSNYYMLLTGTDISGTGLGCGN